jgi:hypothetical protein
MVSMGKPYSRYRSFNDAVSLTIFIAIDRCADLLSRRREASLIK